MKKALKRVLRLGALIAALLIVAVAAMVLLFLFDKPLVKNILQAQLGKRAGLAIRAGKLDYSFFPFRLTAEAVELGGENDFQKWQLAIARLEAKGDFRKLVRGMKPALETVEAEGAVFHLEQKAFSEMPADLEAIVRRAADTLGLAKRISAGNARLTVSLPARLVSLENFDISLAPGEEKAGLTFSLGRADIDFQDKGGNFRLRSRLTCSGTLRLDSPLNFDATLALDSPRVAAAGFEESLSFITVDSTGLFDLRSKRLAASRLKVGIPGLLDAEGTAEAEFGQRFYFGIEATARCDKLENLAALLGPRLPADVRKTRIRGRAVLAGRYEIRRSGEGTTDSLAGSLALEDVAVDALLNGHPLTVQASGKIQAFGPSRDPRLSVDVRTSTGRFSLANLIFTRSDLHVAASITKKAATFTKLEAVLKGLLFDAADRMSLSFDSVSLTGRAGLNFTPATLSPSSVEAGFDAAINKLFLAAAPGKDLSFDHITLKGKMGFDTGKKIAILNSLEARIPGLAPLFAEGWCRLKKNPAIEARLKSSGQDIPGLRAFLEPFLPESLAGWDLGGSADLSLEVLRPASSGADWGFSGSLSLAQARFNDPSFLIAGEGLDPLFRFEGEYTASKELSFRGALDISRGESLWKAVYVPWSKHPLRTTFAGRTHPDSGGIDGLETRFFFPSIGQIDLSGSVKTRPALSLDLRSEAALNLGPLYSLYIEAGVSEESRMSIGGTMRAGLHVLKEGEDLSVTGKLTLSKASLERPSTNTALLDVDAELPLHYETGKAAADSSGGSFPEEGFLRVGEFRNPLMTMESITVPLRAGANAFSIGPFAQEFYGGRLELGRMVVQVDPKSGLFQGAGSLVLRDLDISRLPIRSPQFKLTGRVQADFPKLDISPEKIAVAGRGEAAVFGGKVVLRDLIISSPFTPGRAISLNIDLLDLDLKKLTDEIPFGEVTGIVRGEVRNLVISYKQPERFELRVESVPRKGVPQTFSLKAVDNLTVLSSGRQATAGTSQFWMRFIRGFRYDKLGIVSTLRNDTFTLNGTIHEGGVEYLVKKPRFFGINVINRMPEKQISFKEMTSRLRRVSQSEK